MLVPTIATSAMRPLLCGPRACRFTTERRDVRYQNKASMMKGEIYEMINTITGSLATLFFVPFLKCPCLREKTFV